MSLASNQRHDLCELFEELGALAPTLCGSWKTQDLAAHLWIREHKPLALPGIGFAAFAQRTERIQISALHERGYLRLVSELRRPGWLMAPVDRFVNAAEFTIHHMDVLKPQGRRLELSEEHLASLWPMVRLLAKRLRFDGRITLEWDEHRSTTGKGSRHIHIVGQPHELLFFVSGRHEHAEVELIGEPEAIDELRAGITGM